MEPEVSFVMLNFHRRLKRILGNKVKDIIIIDQLFNYNWEDVKSEIRVNTEKSLALLEELPDLDFKLYALHTAVRSYYTYKTHTFSSKLQALELMENDFDFCAHHDLISKIKVYRSMLSEEEKVELNKLELSQINEIVLKIHKAYKR